MSGEMNGIQIINELPLQKKKKERMKKIEKERQHNHRNDV